MRDEHLGQVRHQVGDPVARPDTARLQRPRYPLRLGRQLGVGEPPRAVDHSGLAGPHSRRPLRNDSGDNAVYETGPIPTSGGMH
jgi:hypothetical protein